MMSFGDNATLLAAHNDTLALSMQLSENSSRGSFETFIFDYGFCRWAE